MPTKAPVAKPFLSFSLSWDACPSDPCGVCVPGPEWLRLLCDLPGGGGVYGGGGGAGPFSKEFPSYLFYWDHLS
uniref:Uncharacterized protein n=1 Tax=Nelumbo nucifera TaxID=4432 RepID=A0A822Y1D0_NELNU|nr:TPA_asm: hypothetical protein HUJ06_024921 [Nelumbo nucifera]